MIEADHICKQPVFVVFVDINAFAVMVEKSEGNLIAQFTRDVLDIAIQAVQVEGGAVFNVVGDAIVGALPDEGSTARFCFLLAKQVNRMREYLSFIQEVDDPTAWDFSPGGPSIKVGISHGRLDCSTISTQMLGTLNHFVGVPINEAARITGPGIGNRCHVSEAAAMAGLNTYPLEGPFEVEGKPGERTYTYYEFDLGEIWISGEHEEETGETHWT